MYIYKYIYIPNFHLIAHQVVYIYLLLNKKEDYLIE